MAWTIVWGGVKHSPPYLILQKGFSYPVAGWGTENSGFPHVVEPHTTEAKPLKRSGGGM
jgi:hypothetical protein